METNCFRAQRSHSLIIPNHQVQHLIQEPVSANDRFSRVVRRNQNIQHDNRVTEYLSNLQNFIDSRVGSRLKLSVPGQSNTQSEETTLRLIDDYHNRGFQLPDWRQRKLSQDEVTAAVREMSVLHAAGLAYRMSISDGFEEKYPWMTDDLFTSFIVKELLAKYLDSYLHYLSILPGVGRTVEQLRKIKHRVFELIVSLRRPTDTMGKRFRTVCHGDLWMGNLMFRGEGEDTEAVLLNFHSAGYLSPASDLARLLLTSTERRTSEDWDDVVQEYYTAFSDTLCEFNLVLRHLGMPLVSFQQEVRRALAGEFLYVVLVIPIVAMYGPLDIEEKMEGTRRYTRRRKSSADRTNTVRHLIQMMAIKERLESSSEDESEDVVPAEWESLHRDDHTRTSLVELLTTAQALDLTQWMVGQVGEAGAPGCVSTTSLDNTKMTTGRHRPVYVRTQSATTHRQVREPRKRNNTL